MEEPSNKLSILTVLGRPVKERTVSCKWMVLRRMVVVFAL